MAKQLKEQCLDMIAEIDEFCRQRLAKPISKLVNILLRSLSASVYKRTINKTECGPCGMETVFNSRGW